MVTFLWTPGWTREPKGAGVWRGDEEIILKCGTLCEGDKVEKEQLWRALGNEG